MVYETAEIILFGITVISLIVSQVCFWVNYFQEKTGMISRDTTSPCFIVSAVSSVIFVITSLLHDQIMSISEKIITGITSVIPARHLFFYSYIFIFFIVAVLLSVGLSHLSEKYSFGKNFGCLIFVVLYGITLLGVLSADSVEKYFVLENTFDVKGILLLMLK